MASRPSTRPTSSTSTLSTRTPPKAATLRQSGFGGFDSLNPFINKGVAADDIGLIYDTLTRHSLDEPFTEYGLLAEKIEVAPDHSWVRFHLRPQARFHDGQAVTAADVVFTFDALMKDGAPQYKAYYADVAKATAEDAQRVRFDFKRSNNRELPLILGQMPVLPKHWWSNREFNKGNLEIPLGSGPYKVADVAAGRSIRYERVKDYWGNELAVNRGFYNFDSILIDYLPRHHGGPGGAQGRAVRLLAGILSAKNWASAYDVPAVKRRSPAQGRDRQPQSHRHAGLRVQHPPPLVSGPRVREAMGLLFDFEWTNKQLFNGAYTRTHSYFENSELAASGLPSAATS